ncbi:arrestin domain-containing protein, partial [Diplocarpon rosae]
FRLELRKLASRENAKRVLGSVFPPFVSNPPSATSSAASSTRSQSPALAGTFPRASLSPGPVDTNTDTIFARRAAGATAAAAAAAAAGDSVPPSPPVTMSRPALADSTNLNPARSSIISAPTPRASFNATRSRRNSAAPSYQAASSAEFEKPIASSGGIACHINLAEPVIFLTGLDHDGTTRDSGSSTTSLLRGKLILNITKNVKIKTISLKFTGRARTLWPEGIPPEKTELFEEDSLRTQVLPFFNFGYEEAESGYGTQCNYIIRGDRSANSSVTNLALDLSGNPGVSGFSLPAITNRASTILSSREQKRLSWQSEQSRSFTKSESQYGPTPRQKGYKTFYPGIYEYNFELPIDNNSPESLDVKMAYVKWNLEAVVGRAGTFKGDIVGHKEIPVIRSPSEDSLELVEPISICRRWEDQLYYEIMISGKTFPLGSKIPIAFKLMPLAKVQVHKIKVYISETVEYHAKNKKVTRREPQRKILLFEKSAGKPLAKEYQTSVVTTTRGGEQSQQERASNRDSAQNTRRMEAARAGVEPEPLPDQTDNMLGDIELGLSNLLGSTEMEIEVQLPTCELMAKDATKKLTHACTWKNVDVHHWIKIVLRISRLDAADPTGKKRRHFEISIDSPISLLNCRATQANLALPSYTDGNTGLSQQRVCGCPNAAPIATPPGMPALETSPDGPFPGNENADLVPDLARPPQAHLSTNAASGVLRPMHLLRAPSFSPPPFDAEDAPPQISTPPPQYDQVVGTPSHDALTDYFQRFTQFVEDHTSADDESPNSSSRAGRVNVVNPRTPGGRLARSMDIDRNFMFNTDAAAALPAVPLSGPNLTVPEF